MRRVVHNLRWLAKVDDFVIKFFIELCLTLKCGKSGPDARDDVNTVLNTIDTQLTYGSTVHSCAFMHGSDLTIITVSNSPQFWAMQARARNL
jgi:hypothetical protein